MRRSPRRRSAVLHALLASLLVVPLVPLSLTVTATTAEARDVFRLTIDLFDSRVEVLGGAGQILQGKGDVTWRNRSGRTLSVTSSTGVLDSGPIPDGGSFHASLPVAGLYDWESEVGSGVVQVSAPIGGQPDDRALDGIPDLLPPSRDPQDFSTHPDLLVEASRSVAIVGLSPSATVREAQQALRDWSIVGGLPNVGLLYASLGPQTTFAPIDSAIDRLNSSAAVEFATYDFVEDLLVLPEPVTDPSVEQAGDSSWTWETAEVAADGNGANWGLELTRVPQAWNLVEGARADGAQDASATVVVDSGFAAHEDLARLDVVTLCGGGTFADLCTGTPASDHGNEVAGIIGADEDPPGVTGIDPLSRLIGVTWKGAPEIYDVRGDEAALALLLDALTAGELSDVSVVNLSIGLRPPAPKAWWDAHADKTCGPGAGDDSTGTGVCYPSTYDPHIEAYSKHGEAARRVIQAFTENLADPPLFVAATGNYSAVYCRDKTVDCYDGVAPDLEPQGVLGSAYNWANRNWNPAVGENPIISVEALGEVEVKPIEPLDDYPMARPGTDAPSRSRAVYSNIDGDVSAPGWTVSTCGAEGAPNTYCLGRGTSLAAPVVSGVAGLIASRDPDLSAAAIKSLLMTWAVPDTGNGAAPRVDAYAPLLALPGAARAMVDVNDSSQDGNRRVVYGPDGSPTALDTMFSSRDGFFTDPDGVVDLRDFRRFRDAWLLRCTLDPEPGCPDPSRIRLDGAPDHPKRDLNQDGVVSGVRPSPDQREPSDLVFPRFDFNGDGLVSRTATSLVPLRATGDPAANPGEAGPMTDLDVLAAQWDADASGALGVEADELDDLLVSGDLTLVADALGVLGAAEAQVALIDDVTDDVVDTYTLVVDDPDDPVLTIPAGRSYRLAVQAAGAETCEVTIGPLSLRPGEDRRVDLDAGLSVQVEPSALRPGQSGQVLVSGTSCSGDVQGTSVDLTLEPTVTDGAGFEGGATSVSVTLDAEGEASVALAGGDVRGLYEVTATATLPTSSGPRDRGTSGSFFVGEFYELEVAAADDSGSGYAALDEFVDPGTPLGPSVNAGGDVAFGALADGADSYEVYVASPGDLPDAPATVMSAGTIPVGGTVDGEPELNDAGEVAFATSATDGDELITTIVRSDGTPTELARGVSTLGSTSAPYERVSRPTVNGDGRVLFRATKQGGEDVLAERQGDLVVEGPTSPFVRPQLADDGTSVVQATVARDCADYPGVCGPLSTQILDPIILVGDGLQARRVALAEGRVDGWGTLSDPDISPTGDVVAFVGDKDGQRGLWVSVRRADGSWQPASPVAGPAAAGSDVVEVDLDRPTLGQVETGAAGPSGDRLLVAFRGTASGSGAPAANAALVLPVDLVATGDDTVPVVPRPQNPRVVAQVGDVLDGRTLSSIALSDALALASEPEFGDDHWVTFFAETSEGGNVHVRARALPTVQSAVGVVAAVVGWARTLVSGLLSADGVPTVDPADVEVLPGPHVAAITVDDDTPAARVPTTVTNRSRALDGTPAWGILDENAGGSSAILDNPVPLPPNGSYDVTFPDRGLTSLRIGAPVAAGEVANDVQFQVQVGQGDNRTPVVQVPEGPFLLAPGQPLDLEATGADPDGDRVTYAWDLDDDGVFDDSALRALRLSPGQVQTQICGGTCTLDVPYPVAVEISDDRGLSAVARTQVTISGLDDLVLRLEPALTTINPGSVGTAFAFVDAPAGAPAVPVDLSVEGVPAGWNVGVTSSVSSGESAQVTVRVPSEAPETSVTVDVVARAGDIEKRVELTVVTVFALIPECTGTIAGTVVDENGDPVAFADLTTTLFGPARSFSTDADGAFDVGHVLRAGFEVEKFRWTALRDGRRDPPFYGITQGGPSYVRCDETTEITPVLPILDPVESVTARAVLGLENPVNPARPIATNQPLPGAEFTARYQPERFPIEKRAQADTDGAVTFTGIPVQRSSGGDLNVLLGAAQTGYWSLNRTIRLSPADALQTVDAGDFPLVPACTGTVTGGVVVDQFGDPVENARVRVRFSGDDFVLSGPDGSFELNRETFLGAFNRATTVTIEALAPTDWSPGDQDFATAFLGSCGAQSAPVTLDLERPEPPPPEPTEYLGSLLGSVTERGTGDPIPGAYVDVFYAESFPSSGGRNDGVVTAVSNPDGEWGPRQVLLGQDDPTISRDLKVRVDSRDHVVEVLDVTLDASTELRLDVELEPRQKVTLTGTVTDVETGEPVADARVITQRGAPWGYFPTSVGDRSGDDGSYELSGLFLDDEDAPREIRVDADFSYLPFGSEPYWPTSASTTLVPDGPNVLDLQMLRVCEGVTVRGVVVNAATLEPLPEVSINANGVRTQTDEQGRYEVTGLRVDRDNQPRQISVRASKEGFTDNQAVVTGFCGAEIIVDFGQPSGGFGTVVGTVTDGDSGDPLADVFIGSSWGDSTSTGDDGTYELDRAPLSRDGEPRDWTITAVRGSQRSEKTVTVSADEAAVADFSFTEPEDVAPVADDQTVQTEPDEPVDIVLTGRDPDGADITFDVVEEPQDGTLSGTPPTLTYTPDSGFVGTDSFVVTASDGALTSAPATITIEVQPPPNQPPTIVAPTTVDVVAGESRQIAVTGNDPDDDDLTFELSDDAAGRASLVSNGDGTAVVTVTTDVADGGTTFDVGVSVTDGAESATATIEVTVTQTPDDEVNQAPEPSIDLPSTISEGDAVTFDASGSTDPDGDSLTFGWTLVDFAGDTVATGSGPTWQHTFTDDFVGGVRLTATDARDEQATVEVDVVAVNVDPVVAIESLDVAGANTPVARPSLGLSLLEAVRGGGSAAAGSDVSLLGSFTDPGTGDTHEVTVIWGDGASESIEHRGGEFGSLHRYSAPGDYVVSVQVCDDDQGCGTTSTTVTVTPNDQPDGGSSSGDGSDAPATGDEPDAGEQDRSDGDVGGGTGADSADPPSPGSTTGSPTSPSAPVPSPASLPETGARTSSTLLLASALLGLGMVLAAAARPEARRRGAKMSR